THTADTAQPDIIDESLALFRPNSLFRNFEIKGPADRVLIYLILFIGDCLGKIAQARTWTAQDALKHLTTHALAHFALPGEPGFPLNQVFQGPAAGDRVGADALRAYLVHARQETVLRLVEQHVYNKQDESTEGGARPSKWWMAFQVRLRADARRSRSENASAPYGATCMHGEQECRGNTSPVRPGIDTGTRHTQFVQCMNYGDTTKIGSEAAAKQCARVVGREWTEQIASCVEGKQGRSLLVESLRRAERLDVERSCTVLIEGEQVCVHDGSWKSCPGGHEVRDFAREVREAWDKVNRGESRLDDDE
ncbi:actin-related protein ARPC3, partial [Rhodotorula diobovata]